jgi:AcrR family transcriptional regulator
VVAAAELFAERGLTVPLEDVARAAEVGVATLYRRFPTRAELAMAVFERNISSYMDVVDRALADPRPWESFRDLVVALCALQASDPGLRAILTTAFPPSSQIERQTAQIVEKVGEVLVRAQADGSLRPDLAVGDVVVMVLANAGVVEATRTHAPDAWRRFAALMVDAFRAGKHSELPDSISPEQLRRSVALLTGETVGT